MTLTPYDRRQVAAALARIQSSRFQLEIALTDGNYSSGDTALRCAFAGKYAAEAADILTRTDKRIQRRAKK